jgi:hypothetical protein
MRPRFALILPFVLLAGCSVDTSGLGDDFTEDAGDDTTISSDETGSLFDAVDETELPDSDATVEETAAEVGEETAIDSTVSETVDETIAETGEDADAEIDADAADSTLEAEAAIDADIDSAVDSAVDVAPDSADAAPDTSTTGITSTPGLTACSHSGTTKLCLASEVCCGRYDVFSLSWTWDCAGSCIAGREYKCDEKADCPSGQICCGTYVAFTTTINGSDCRTSCGGDAQLCTTNAECGAKTCTPQKAPDAAQTIGVCK